MSSYFNGFPASYSNPYYAQNQPPAPPQMQTHTQSGGFIRVQSENEARMYPIQPGTSATFIDENQPYCYTKTLDFSQLDRPIFKRFRLVEETEPPQSAQNAPQTALQDKGIDLAEYALKADTEALSARIDELQALIESLQAKKTTAKVKKEDEA